VTSSSYGGRSTQNLHNREFGEDPNEVRDAEGLEGAHIGDIKMTVYYKKQP